MGAMASQITSLTIVYSTVYSGVDQRQSSALLAFVGNSPVTGEFPAQMASNAENVSIWWRHHEVSLSASHPRHHSVDDDIQNDRRNIEELGVFTGKDLTLTDMG